MISLFKYSFYFVAMVSFAFLLMSGGTAAKEGQQKEAGISMLNNLSTNLTATFDAMALNYTVNHSSNISDTDAVLVFTEGLVKTIYKGVSFVTFAAIEADKFAYSFGYDNPQFDYNRLIDLAYLGLILFMIKPIIMALIFVRVVVEWLYSTAKNIIVQYTK